MRLEPCDRRELDSVAWEEVQGIVRVVPASPRPRRTTGDRGLSARAGTQRKAVLIELVHEEMELRIKAGESSVLDVVPRAIRRHRRRPARARRAGRGRVGLAAADDGRGREEPAAAAEEAASSGAAAGPHRPLRAGGRDRPGRLRGRLPGVGHDAQRAVALKRPRPGTLDARGGRRAVPARGPQHGDLAASAHRRRSRRRPVRRRALPGQRPGRGPEPGRRAGVRRPGFRRSAEWVAALAEALEHAHWIGVIHRDVKPSNVLIDREGHVYLTDFGLAKSDAGEATLTIDGQVIGTPAYMAPEQTGGTKEGVDARTDVYSLGVILYELLTGTRPFPGAADAAGPDPRGRTPAAPAARRHDPARPRDDLPEGDGQGSGASLPERG